MRPSSIRSLRLSTGLALLLLVASSPSIEAAAVAPQQGVGPQGDVAPAESAEPKAGEDGVVVYEFEFFDKYNPVTALDVVSRTPGFSVARGRENRGFGSASGNILIDGERPTSKSDSVSDILSRIPAGLVERVELVRGATGGLDVNGQSIVANVVLRAGRSGSGFAALQSRYQGDEVNVEAELSYDGHMGATDFLVGVQREARNSKNVGVEQLTRASGLDERREETSFNGNENWGGSLRTETALGARDTLRLSAQVSTDPGDSSELSKRFPSGGGDPDIVVQGGDRETDSFEFGGDYDRRLGLRSAFKLIGLVRRDFRDSESTLDVDNADGSRLGRRSLSSTTNGETIGRAEFDLGASDHTVQLSGEVARNFVDSEFELFTDEGAGFVPVNLDGANTRVSEIRGEWAATDSWSPASLWTIDAGMAFEISTISQSGDIENERTFRFAKPSLAVTFSPSAVQQWRFRFEREVAQLDFFDFVSRADFDDQELDFGNPELEPERTWAFEAAFERRFGQIGVVEVRFFYDSIQQVQDLLPIGGTLEVDGNIGDGTRRGVDIDATVALDAIGLRNSRLELGLFFQHSSVTDPVSGLDRSLSGERDSRVRIAYRQEFPTLRASWGASVFDSGERRFYGLDELTATDSELQVELFAEKVVGNGFKIRFEAENLLNRVTRRERTVFEGARTLGILNFRELRNRTEGREFALNISRAF